MKTFVRTALITLTLLAGPVTSAFAFGAIAVNDSQGTAASEAGYGMGWGSSRQEAERNAVRECKSAGNEDCTVAVWFERCGAYAGDRVNYGIGYGSTLKAAEKMATADCPNCQIIVSDCQ
ncbi:hypothetical protein ASG25_11100 [Rhizobium sp. Leaf384]|uniref:DUF4189 domain-containing protein n=1 Tax=unclassified Rhizobium TaxID=2613769 RepID=UPI000712F667|nr:MULTISPECIES: DUF4189 domain-containing protein [unclassified Rhizobium]KQS79117.1 hypothetical protein ASG25_11100 [Rhizobium sp. Leaf384]KQS82684.1 hypothetical protein ASG58_04915 [Rhizobium sp. Leaf383]